MMRYRAGKQGQIPEWLTGQEWSDISPEVGIDASSLFLKNHQRIIVYAPYTDGMWKVSLSISKLNILDEWEEGELVVYNGASEFAAFGAMISTRIANLTNAVGELAGGKK